MLRRSQPAPGDGPSAASLSSLASLSRDRPVSWPRQFLTHHRKPVALAIGAAALLLLIGLHLEGGPSGAAAYRLPFDGPGSVLALVTTGQSPSSSPPEHHSPPADEGSDPCHWAVEQRLHDAYLAGHAHCGGAASAPGGAGIELEALELTCPGPPAPWPWRQRDRNVTFHIYPGGKDVVSNGVRKRGEWEADMIGFLLRAMAVARRQGYFDDGDGEASDGHLYVLDVGANLGAHSLCLAAGGYQVLAFEPMPTNLAALRRSLCANPDLLDRVTVLPFGLSDRPQDCTMVVDNANRGDGLLRCDLPANHTDTIKETVVGTHIPVLTLDGALHCPNGRNKRRIAGVKIDVENHEMFVVRGGQEFLRAHRPPVIVYENFIMPYNRRRELLDHFLAQGYFYGCIQPPHGSADATVPTREAFNLPPAEVGTELLFECVDIFWVDPSLVEARVVPVREGSTRVARRLFLKAP